MNHELPSLRVNRSFYAGRIASPYRRQVHFDWVLEGRAIQDVWHITWFDPNRAVELHQIGRAQGEDIVQIGEDPKGLLRRWRFVEITSTSFTWLGEVSWDKGSTWTLEIRMRASKVSGGR